MRDLTDCICPIIDLDWVGWNPIYGCNVAGLTSSLVSERLQISVSALVPYVFLNSIKSVTAFVDETLRRQCLDVTFLQVGGTRGSSGVAMARRSGSRYAQSRRILAHISHMAQNKLTCD